MKNTELSYKSRPRPAILINLDSLSSMKITLAQIRGNERKSKQRRIQKIPEKEVEALLILCFCSPHKTGIPKVKQGISLTFDCHQNQTCEVKTIITLPRLLFSKNGRVFVSLENIFNVSHHFLWQRPLCQQKSINVFLQLVHRSCTND